MFFRLVNKPLIKYLPTAIYPATGCGKPSFLFWAKMAKLIH
jgi:hypothetical protein